MEELEAERQVVKRALAERDIDAWVFEADAGSRSASAQETYRRELADAHLYIGLFWNGFGKYTHDEFEYARQLQKDCLIFEKRDDIEGKRDPTLQEFLQRLGDVKSGLTIRRFHTLEELSQYIKADVAAWQSDTIARLQAARSRAPFEAPPLSDKHVLRETLLRKLKKAVLPGEEQSVCVTRATLHGAGGVGKSIAAAAFAHDPEVVACFPHGTLWAHVGDNPDALAVLSSWGRSLRDPEMPAAGYSTQTEATNQLRTLLKDKACLLVLDDVWHPDLVREAFLVGGPRCLLLVTTRKSEVARRIAATEIPVSEMDEDEALTLLTNWVGGLNKEDKDAARWFARQVACLPLAIELIGAGVAKLGDWTEYRARWDEQKLNTLKRERGASGKADNLKDSIALSLQFLASDDDRRSYVRLAVFPKGTPFPATACAVLFQWTESEASEFLLDVVGQALLTRQPSAFGPRYRMHDLLHDFTAERLGGEGLEAAHRSLAYGYKTRCHGRWASTSDDGYFFEHIARHLCAARLSDELDALIDHTWMDAKLRLTRSHRSFYQDVELAIDLAVSLDPLPLLPLVRGCLIKNTLTSLASRIPPPLIGVLALAGEVDRAHGYAAIIPDATARRAAWASIAEASILRGDAQSAPHELLHALECAVNTTESEERRQLIDQAITALSTSFSPAEILGLVQHRTIGGTVIGRMVARALAATAPDEATKELLRVASLETLPLMLRFGQFDRAVDVARSSKDERSRLLHLRTVTRAMMDAGEFKRALALAEEHEALWDSSSADAWFIPDCARALAAVENPSGIGETISEVHHRDLREQIGLRVVGMLAQGHDLTRAQEAAASLTGEEHQGRAMYIIVSTLVQRQSTDAAWTVTTSMQGGWRAVAAADVAKSRAAAGLKADVRQAVGDALANVDRMSETFMHAVTLAWAAESLARIGATDEAVSLADRAMAHVAADADSRERIVPHVATALAAAGKYGEARQAAGTIQSWRRSAGFGDLGKALVAAGEHARAIALLDDLDDDLAKLNVLKTIGPVLVEDDAYDTVSTALATFKSEDYKWQAVTSIAAVAIGRRAFHEVLSWLKTLSPHYRRSLLEQLTEPMIDAGEFAALTDAVDDSDQDIIWHIVVRQTRHDIRAGRIDESYRADGIDMPEEKRSELQREVALTLIELGSLDRAYKAAINVEGIARDLTIVETAVALAKAGRLSDAVRLIGNMTREDDGRVALASALVTTEQIEAALKIALSIDRSHFFRNDPLESIGKAQLRLGSYDASRSTALSMTEDTRRTDLLAQVAWALAKDGRVEEGLKLAADLLPALDSDVEPETGERLVQRAALALGALPTDTPAPTASPHVMGQSDDWERVRAAVLGALAADDVDGALAIAEAVPLEPYANRWARTEAMVSIADHVAQSGPSERGLLLARSALDGTVAALERHEVLPTVSNTRSHTLLATSWTALVRAGGCQSAPELISAIKGVDLGVEDNVFAEIAPLLAASGRLEWALEIVGAIKAGWRKMDSLVATIDALGAQGETPSALQAGRAALRDASRLDPLTRIRALSSLASALIRAGDTELWKATLSAGLDRDRPRDVAWIASHAALALSDRGLHDLAAELARRHWTSADGEHAGRFGLVFARHGTHREASDIARGLRNGGRSTNPLEAAQEAEIWALVGRPTQSLAALHYVQFPEAKRRVIGILARQVTMHRPDQVARFWYEAVSGIGLARDRAAMLALIAIELEGTALGEHSTAILERALVETRNTDRWTVLNVITTGTPILVRLDEGRLLRRICDQVLLIESWWTPGVAAPVRPAR